MDNDICKFCKLSIIPEFQHRIQHKNCMVGVLETEDQLCDACYSKLIMNPCSKEEHDNYIKQNGLLWNESQDKFVKMVEEKNKNK